MVHTYVDGDGLLRCYQFIGLLDFDVILIGIVFGIHQWPQLVSVGNAFTGVPSQQVVAAPHLMKRSTGRRPDEVGILTVFMASQMLDHFDHQTDVLRAAGNDHAEGSRFQC